MPDTRATIPTLGTLKGVNYYAKTSDGQWHYINHAGEWVTCPPPFRDKCPTCQGLHAVPKDIGCGCTVYVGCPTCDPTGEHIKAATDPSVPPAALNNH